MLLCSALFARALTGLNVRDLITKVGSSTGSAPAAAPASTVTAPVAESKKEEKVEKEEEKEEEEDEDMGFGESINTANLKLPNFFGRVK